MIDYRPKQFENINSICQILVISKFWWAGKPAHFAIPKKHDIEEIQILQAVDKPLRHKNKGRLTHLKI